VLATDTMGISTLYKYMKAFGIGEQSGLSFPGESRGILADVGDWSAPRSTRCRSGRLRGQHGAGRERLPDHRQRRRARRAAAIES